MVWKLFCSTCSVDWEMATSATWDDHNIIANNFYDLFHSILDEHAPLKIWKGITRHAPSPWISPCIKNLIHGRDRAKKRAEKDRSMWPEYKGLRNRVTSELRRTVQGYYRTMIDENFNNPREMWKTINKVLNKNEGSTTPKFVMFEGQLVEKQKKLRKKVETKGPSPLKAHFHFVWISHFACDFRFPICEHLRIQYTLHSMRTRFETTAFVELTN